MGFYNISQKKSEVKSPFSATVYFGPKTTPFLESSSLCRTPKKKCKLATPEVIRRRPGRNFGGAIQIARAARLSAVFFMMFNYFETEYEDEKKKKKTKIFSPSL